MMKGKLTVHLISSHNRLCCFHLTISWGICHGWGICCGRSICIGWAICLGWSIGRSRGINPGWGICHCRDICRRWGVCGTLPWLPLHKVVAAARAPLAVRLHARVEEVRHSAVLRIFTELAPQ